MKIRTSACHAVVAVVRHGHGFGKTLGFIVNATRPNGIDVSPVFFGLGSNFGVAVAFAGGSRKNLAFFASANSRAFWCDRATIIVAMGCFK